MNPQQQTEPAERQVVCAFPTRPGVAGHIDACQLCPASGTYWRGEPTADVCRYDKPVGRGQAAEEVAA